MVSNTLVDVNKPFSIPNESFEQILKTIPDLYQSLTQQSSSLRKINSSLRFSMHV